MLCQISYHQANLINSVSSSYDGYARTFYKFIIITWKVINCFKFAFFLKKFFFLLQADLENMILRKPIKGKLRRSRDPALWVEHKQSKNNSSVYVKLHRVQVSKTDNNNDILLLSLPSRHRTKGLSFYVMISMEGYEPSKWAKSQSKNSQRKCGTVFWVPN